MVRHCEDFTGLRVHHDYRATVSLVFDNRPFEFTFRDVLNGPVNGEYEIHAVQWWSPVAVAEADLVSGSVTLSAKVSGQPS